MELNGKSCLPPPSPTDQQVFDHLKCEVIESLRQPLSKSLIPDRHMDFLRSKRILSAEDCEEINHLPTQRKRASMFLDILEKKGAEAYNALCEALKEEGTQMFLLRQLHEDFERRQRRYRELVSPQKKLQGLPPLTPPLLLPPPPPSYHHHHQGNGLKPIEHAYPHHVPASQSLSPSVDSCPGSVSSTMATMNSCPGYLSTLTNGSAVTSATEGTGVVDLQKQRLDVAAYLQSLTVRQDESMREPQMVSSPQQDSSFEHQLPTFLSSAATWGSSTDDRADLTINQSASSATLPTPTQDSQASHTTGDQPIIKHHQRPPLFSRGSLQETSICSSLVEGGSTGLPSFPLLLGHNSEPVENEDTSVDSSSVLEHSFFGSLENSSLASPSSGSGSSCPPILCDTALSDQREALGKCCRCHVDPVGDGENTKEVEEFVRPKTCMTNTTELSSQLSCLSAAHITDKKTVVETSSSPDSSLSCDTKDSTQSSETDFLKKGEGGESSKEESLEFEEGLSRENRTSVCDKSGHSLHSSQC